MSDRFDLPPRVAWIYGLLGLIPFFVAAGLTIVSLGDTRSFAQMALLGYAGLILSFLGGGRWGLEIGRGEVRPAVISASMLPTVFAFLIIVAFGVSLRLRLAAMAAALVGQWVWDVRSKATPSWYPALRHVLTAGAVACLLIGATAASICVSKPAGSASASRRAARLRGDSQALLRRIPSQIAA